MLSTILFYIFSSIIILSSIGVISSKNPVYAVLYLILAFLNSAILFLFLNAEFLAMLLIVVYVGAVAVLFLFVVMMLNIKQEEKTIKFQKYTPFSLFIFSIVFIELAYVFLIDDKYLINLSNKENLSLNNNTVSLGNILYTEYALLFQMSGVILFVAMIGAIVLTMRSRPGVKKQIIKDQVNTKKSDVIEVVSVNNREGA